MHAHFHTRADNKHTQTQAHVGTFAHTPMYIHVHTERDMPKLHDELMTYQAFEPSLYALKPA